MKKIFLFSLTVFFIALSSQAAKTGKEAYDLSCKECHGDNGAGGKDFGQAPNITILDEFYFRKQFDAIRKKIRKGPGATLMNVYLEQKAKLSKEEIEAAIQYALKLKPAEPNHKKGFGDASNGAARYALCGTCHGQSGKGNINPALLAPRLAGQADFYIVDQLKNFKNGHRGNGTSISEIQMKGMANYIENEKVMKDIAAYLRSFKLIKDK